MVDRIAPPLTAAVPAARYIENTLNRLQRKGRTWQRDEDDEDLPRTTNARLRHLMLPPDIAPRPLFLRRPGDTPAAPVAPPPPSDVVSDVIEPGNVPLPETPPGEEAPQLIPPPPQRTVDSVDMRPAIVVLPQDWEQFLAPAMVGTHLDLTELTPDILARLSQQNLEILCQALSEVKVEIEWHVDGASHHRFPYFESTNAEVSGVSALALAMHVRREQDALIRLLIIKPVEIVRDLADRVPMVFTLDVIVAVFKDLVDIITSDVIDWAVPENTLANAGGSMVKAFLAEYAGEQPELIDSWLVALMVHLEESGFEPTTENLGVLAGTIIAGGLKYCDALKAADTSRYYAIDKTALLIWAASTMIPLITPVSGLLSVMSVVGGIVLERFYPIRDLGSFITQLEGQLRLRLLKLKIFRTRYEVSLLMDYLHSTILCNGYR